MPLLGNTVDPQEATGKFGVASTEARLAWELVEEMEESLGSSIASLFPKPLDQECDVETDEAKCRDFEMKMSRLQEIAATAQSINYQIKFQVEKLQNLKVERSVPAARAVNSAAFKAAKDEAEAAAAKSGKDSTEAKVAWEAVFEIVSSADDDKVSMGSLEDECLLSTSSKCDEYNGAMKKLQATIDAKM
mmetsp:Transcript_725/g.1552  ORF Transcript_725/g.1552 Transcript_725/m.1552 type:complete len:190 (-) Transcript_725:256-825(-)